MPPDRGRPAVFLDRDGVLNKPIVRNGLPFSPSTVDEFELYPEAPAACAQLRAAGYLLVVVTNQPEVARGTLDLEALDAMHARLGSAITVDQIRVCPHDSDDGCACRKPKPGMVLDAAGELGIDLDQSFLVGDRWKDVECAHRAGVTAVFVDHEWQERPPDDPYQRVDSIAGAASLILGLHDGSALDDLTDRDYDPGT